MTQSKAGAVVGGISIVFSMLCFLVTPLFSPAFLLAAFFGICSGGLALGLKARRTALVAFVFALTPLGGFLMLKYVVERAGNRYVFFIPLVLAVIVAVRALMDYRRSIARGPIERRV